MKRRNFLKGLLAVPAVAAIGLTVASAPEKEWTHVVKTWDGAVTKTFINGEIREVTPSTMEEKSIVWSWYHVPNN